MLCCSCCWSCSNCCAESRAGRGWGQLQLLCQLLKRFRNCSGLPMSVCTYSDCSSTLKCVPAPSAYVRAESSSPRW
jgi:hypothetical protein